MKKWKGLLFGIVYGLVARGIIALDADGSYIQTGGLMTISFLFFVPLTIGLITAYYNDTITSSSKILGLSMPLFAIMGTIGISVIFGYEGIICAFMALPIFAVMALLGGYIGVNIFHRSKDTKNDKLYISLFVMLPFLMAPLENYFGLTDKVFSEETTITIVASETEVWKNITRVKKISKQENHLSLFQVMGFPRPIQAELDTVAIGGIRKAIFDRGLFFTETINEVVPNKILRFSIKADPASTPPEALDEHVMVGGKYFDILEGKYEIEKKNNGTLVLHLTSQFRLSTSFNFYSGYWGKLIMRDIQKNILNIIKARSERLSKH